MASVESTSIPSRPYYAPDDPALPKPWKGLVDGSTGLLYYWNIETNVTQYEKPAPLPPKPLREAPSVPMPTLPASPSAQSGGMLSQNGQQVMQSQAQYASYMNQQHGNALQFHSSAVQQPYFTQPSPQVHPYATANISQHNSQSGLPVSSGQHILQSLGQKNSEQNSHQFPQIPLQHGQHTLDDGSQKISHLQGSQLTYPQGHPYALQQSQHALEEGTQQVSHPHRSQMTHTAGHPNVQPVMNYMSYQQGVLPQDSSNSQPSLPISSNNVAHLHPQQSHQEQVDHQKGPRIHISQIPPQQLQQSAISHAPSNFNQMPQMGSQPDPVYSLGQSSRTVQQPASSTQLNLPANDTGTVQTQTFPRFHNQITFSGHGHSLPPFSTNVGLQDSMHRRPGNELYAKAIDDRTAVQSQHPKLAAIPLARNRSDVRMDSRPCAVSPGAMVGPFPGHVSYNAYPDQTAKKASAFVTPGSFPNNTHAILGSIGSAASLSSTEAYCQQHEIMTMGENVPAPLMTFESTGFPPEIMREIHNAGFSSPTPIQAQTWPIALQNRDIVAVAKTGSGKTLGYLIPSFMLLRFRRNNPAHGPTVLVLAPTRELATQIQDEVFKFGRSSRVSCTCLYGGSPKGPQIRELDRGVDIVVATPGRLNDILDMRKINLTQVSLLVLDEADRMLDMGFEPQIRKVVNALPRRRQTLMYTATWPKEVRKIATDLLANPVQVNIGSADELAANKAITQYVEVVQQAEKQRRLEQILRAQERGSRTIVFCSTKRQCDYLVRGIGRTYGAAAIHGDKSQDERDFALGQFRTGRFPVLVATDVAARGLDVKDIRVVINYDFPSGIEDYVHRIGRTGRAGASGISFTFFSDQDAKYAADLIRVLEGANQRVPPDVRALAARAADAAAGRFGDPRWSAGGGAVRGAGYAFRRGAGTMTGFRGRGGRGSDRGGGRFSRRSYSRSPQRYGRSYSRSSTSSGGSQRRSRSPGRTRTSRSPNRARVVVGLENGRGGDDVIRDDDGGSREPVKAPSPTEVALPPPVTVDLPTKTD